MNRGHAEAIYSEVPRRYFRNPRAQCHKGNAGEHAQFIRRWANVDFSVKFTFMAGTCVPRARYFSASCGLSLLNRFLCLWIVFGIGLTRCFTEFRKVRQILSGFERQVASVTFSVAHDCVKTYVADRQIPYSKIFVLRCCYLVGRRIQADPTISRLPGLYLWVEKYVL